MTSLRVLTIFGHNLLNFRKGQKIAISLRTFVEICRLGVEAGEIWKFCLLNEIEQN